MLYYMYVNVFICVHLKKYLNALAALTKHNKKCKALN